MTYNYYILTTVCLCLILDLAFPAHVAAYNGDLAQLKMLIETGVVSVNERDDKGSTPAHKGTEFGYWSKKHSSFFGEHD